MPAISQCDYVSMMLALPGTAAQVAERLDMSGRGVVEVLRRFWSLGLTHPSGVVMAGKSQSVIWSAGSGAEIVCRVRRTRPKAQHIAFATVWRELECGATVPDIQTQVGVSRVTLYAMLERLKGHMHIAGWESDALGRPVAIHRLGAGQSARRPVAASGSEKSRRRRGREAAQRFTHLQAGSSGEIGVHA